MDKPIPPFFFVFLRSYFAILRIEIMEIEELLKSNTAQIVKDLYETDFDQSKIIINETRKEFEGDLTVVVFPFSKIAKKKPEDTGIEIGEKLVEKLDFISSFNVVKGFLNLGFTDDYWLKRLAVISQDKSFGFSNSNGKKVVLEYCGPNTNKPIHLGHIRNMTLGFSVAEILKANGYEVHKVNILNDRGIAICKSMLAWQKFGQGETPETNNTKGDHLVGKYYVKFDQELGKEFENWQNSAEANSEYSKWLEEKDGKKSKEEGKEQSELKKQFHKSFKNTYFNQYSALGAEASEMLLKWENDDPEVRQLWKKMNSWVYDGFQQTFDRLGIDFEEHYKESDFYKEGKNMVEAGLGEEKFYRKEDGSIWADLEEYKLDQKILVRNDGTSLYLTQDIAVAQARYNKYKMDLSIYTVGDEQNYHFKALKAVLQKLDKAYADGIHHLSYGMIDLPSGKMKSREGTVVDADFLIDEVVEKARLATMELGKIEDFSSEQAQELFEKIGIGALRFYILNVNPQKRMLFDPEKSVELNGATAVFIQYAYARIQSVLRKYNQDVPTEIKVNKMEPIERELIIALSGFETTVQAAGKDFDPSLIAQYTYNLAKLFNKFWNQCQILNAEDENVKEFRILLSNSCGNILEKGLNLLGIDTTERM